MKWTENEIKFLKENYTEKGIEYCVINIKRTKQSIINKANLLGLKVRYRKNKNNSLFFHSINNNKINKEISYILGFIWSDGHIDSKYNTTLSIVSVDAKDLINTMLFVDEWKIYHYKPKNNDRERTTFRIGNRQLYLLLKELDFDKKSYVSADKVLKIIPEKYHYIFFRGLSDGDGCFYINKKHYTYQYTLSSTHEQDWSYFINLLDKLGIKYKYIKNVKKNSKSSLIRLTSQRDVKKFGEYIYQKYDNIGLKRKYDKYKLICEYSTGCNWNPIYHTKEELFDMAHKGLSLREIMKKYNYGNYIFEYVKKYEGLKELFDKNSNQSKSLSKDNKQIIINMILGGISNKEIMNTMNIKRGVLSNIKSQLK